MKKTLATLLALVMMCTTAVAFAEEAATEIPELALPLEDLQYEGEWFTFGETGIQMYLPLGWVEHPEAIAGDADDEYTVTNAEQTEFLNLRIFYDETIVNDDADFQSLLQELSTAENASDVQAVKLNETMMITYDISGDVGYGTVILKDGAMLMFETAPATEENATLFLQLLSTYTLEAGAETAEEGVEEAAPEAEAEEEEEVKAE